MASFNVMICALPSHLSLIYNLDAARINQQGALQLATNISLKLLFVIYCGVVDGKNVIILHIQYTVNKPQNKRKMSVT
jgi:hypothetical protein